MSSNVRFVEEPEKQPKPVWPRRVQILEQDYAEKSGEVSKSANRPISVRYEYETIDYLEKIFETYVSENKSSLKVSINACYRVKDKLGKEWYYCHANKQCNNKFNQPVEPFYLENLFWHKSPIIKMQWNEQRGINEPKVVGYTGKFENPWNKEEVRKLLDNSFIPCEQFYVGRASEHGRGPIEERYYSIMNIQDFIEASSWDDLYDMGRLGCSYKEPSLHLVEAARKKERQDREEKLGMKGLSRAYA